MPLFVNVGNTCGINSLIQCLYLVKPNDIVICSTKHQQLTSSLYHVFKLMDIEQDNRKIRPNALVKQIQKHPLFTPGEQTDVNELWLIMCDLINEEIGTLTPEPLLEDNKKIWHQLSKKTSKWANRFMGATIHITQCNNSTCRVRNRNIEIFYSISLQPCKNITDGLTNYFKSVKHTNNGWKCEKCDCNQYQKFVKPLMMPDVLVISINRFNNNMTKNNMEMSINKRIRFHKGTVLGNTHSAYDYTLSCFINHYGVLNGGHYNCYKYERDIDTMVMYDDDLKRTFDDCDVLNNNTDVYLLFYTLDATH